MQALPDPPEVQWGECEWCGVPVLPGAALCPKCHRARYRGRYERGVRLQRISEQAGAALGSMRRNAMLAASVIAGVALLVFAATYFRYAPIANPGGVPLVWDRLRGRACVAPIPPLAKGPNLVCTREEYDLWEAQQ